MYRFGLYIRNIFQKIKNLIFITLLIYLIGVFYGAVYSTGVSSEQVSSLMYENMTHCTRCSLYVVIVFMMSNCSLGIPVILYFLYIYGINNGVFVSVFFSAFKDYYNLIHLFFLSVAFSVVSVIVIGTSAINLSKEVFLVSFSKRHKKITKTFINSVVTLLIGFSFYYFSDIFKIALIGKIK